MRRLSMSILVAALFSLVPFSLMASDAAVQINGPDDLARLKPGIERSLQARLITRGIDLSTTGNLVVTISQMGANISFDAILATTPPKAYHKDIPSVDALSSTIDEMLTALFGSSSAPEPALKAPSARSATKSIELPYLLTSMTTRGDEVFVSDAGSIYKVKGDKAEVWWRIPEKDTIVRISAYQDSIIALTRHEKHFLLNEPDQFISYRITDGRTTQKWNSAVVPSGNGLIAAVLKIAPDITFQSNRWSAPTPLEGQPAILPPGTDIIAATVQDVYPEHPGPETISFSPSGKLQIAKAKEIIWSSPTSFATLPTSLQEDYVTDSGSQDSVDDRKRTQYYFLPPRIVVSNGMVVTIDNNAGLFGVLEGGKVYKSCQIRSYVWAGEDFEERILYKTSLGYCTDIATQNDMLLALIVKKKGTNLTYTSLTRGSLDRP